MSTQTQTSGECNTSTGLKVVGVGYGRTGTTTLYNVLSNEFNLKCYHMERTSEHSNHTKLWTKLSQLDINDPNNQEQKHQLFDEIFNNNEYLATVDWPSVKFWKDLIDYYPNSKVILTIRDPDKWYESANSTIFKALKTIQKSWIIQYNIAKYIFPFIYKIHVMTNNIILNSLPNEVDCTCDCIINENINDDTNNTKGNIDDINDNGCQYCYTSDASMFGKFDNRAYVLNKYEKHIENVKQCVPKDRLLIFDISKHGYDELIEHLKDVPDVKIPNDKRGQRLPSMNSRKKFENEIWKLKLGLNFLDSLLIIVPSVSMYLMYKYVSSWSPSNGSNAD